MKRNYWRGKEKHGWSNCKRGCRPYRCRRPSDSNCTERQVNAALYIAWVKRWMLCLIEFVEWWPSRTAHSTFGISVIPSGTEIALISGNLSHVNSCILMLKWDVVLPSPFKCARLSINISSISKNTLGKKNVFKSSIPSALLLHATVFTSVKLVIKGSSWKFESMLSNVVIIPHLAD